MVQPTQNDSTFHLILLGMTRCVAGFPFEHPLQLWKISAHANPKLSSWQAVNNIVKEKGFFGFTNTMLMNFPRRVLKESVRWPAIAYSHERLILNFPNTFTRDGTKSKVATGISVAIFDSLFILPFEQLMAFRIKEQERYTNFLKKRFAKDGIWSFYQGLGANLIRQGVVWSTVLTINHESKKMFDKVDKEKEHPYLRQGVTSVLIAMGHVTCGLPIDFVKSRIQMDTELQKMKMTSAVRTLFRQFGISGFYAGALPVFIHTTFHASLGGVILDKIFSSNKS